MFDCVLKLVCRKAWLLRMKKALLFNGLAFIMIIALSGCGKNTAGGYYKESKKLLAESNYEGAAECLLEAIAKKPSRADYYIDYGMVLIALGQYEEAIDEFDKIYMNKNIKKIQENNKRIHRGKGIAYYHLMQYDNAIEEFDLALKVSVLSELNMDILYYKGNILKILGWYEKALETYTAIIDMDKDSGKAYGERAYIYRIMGDYEKALENCNKAIELEPKCFEHYFNKYYLMIENNKEEEARKVLQKASEIAIKTKEDKYNLAKVHYYQGNYDTVLEELNESYEDGFLEGYFYIGEIYKNKKDYALAVYYYKEYIDKETRVSPTVYNNIGYCLMKMGEYQQALNYLEQGIAYQYAATQQSLLKNEIIAYEKLGMFDKAQEKLSYYIWLFPNDQEAIRENEFLNTRVGN